MKAIGDFRASPVLAGVIWAILFVPFYLFLDWITDDFEMSLPGLAILVVLAVIGGIAWAFVMRWLLMRKKTDAR